MEKKRIRLSESSLRRLIKESVKRVLNESTYQTIGPILQSGETEEEALEFLHNFDFSDCETEPQSIAYAEYVDSYGGIDMYYDYGADYYFFTVSE